MRLVRWIGIVLAAVLGLLLIVTAAARFSDGPLVMMAGGPLVRGELVHERSPDWQFVTDIDTVEFQLIDPPRSRTTWIIQHEGKIYIPCGYLNTALGRLWKQWPIEAERDGRAILRVGDKLYERQLVRLKDPAIFEEVAKQIHQKYHVDTFGASVDRDELWIFELAPRPDGEA